MFTVELYAKVRHAVMVDGLIPSLEENDPSALAVMAGLDPAIQTFGFRDWMPGSSPGTPTRVTNNETWYEPQGSGEAVWHSSEHDHEDAEFFRSAWISRGSAGDATAQSRCGAVAEAAQGRTRCSPAEKRGSGRSFAEMLEQTIRRYQNRAIEAAQVIEELIQLAKDMREANARGEKLGLSEDELAFYDALETNDSAIKVLGDETLRTIARELMVTVRNNVTIDWTLRENVRAQLRVLVKRILRKYGYPPDKQEKATQTVLEQAEVLTAGWAT